MKDLIVVKVDKARALLAEAMDASDAKHVADLALAAEVYAKRQKLSEESIAYATQLRIEAMAMMGEFLKSAEKAKGRPGPGRGKAGSPAAPAFNSPPTYAEAGISKKEAQAAQALATAKNSNPKLFERIQSGKAPVKEAIREATRQRKIAELKPEKLPQGFVTSLDDVGEQRFGTIYADPPWRYQDTNTRSSVQRAGYEGTLSVEQLCDMPVEYVAAGDAMLHLWATNSFLEEAFRVMKAWGFDYRANFVWCKPKIGMGHYWRNAHEILLLGIRGRPGQFLEADHRSWLEIEAGRHSEKPDEVRSILERVGPGPRLELFGRKTSPGWIVFGNQVMEAVA